ncbi:MAG: hypothetical protein ABS949_07625 [Solibacillus sp.]
MNRKKIYKGLDKSKKPFISEVQESLLIIKNSHHSNELIVNRLQKVAENEQQAALYNALKKDMELINEQLKTLLENIQTTD